MEEELICGACNMVFHSSELLGKHTAGKAEDKAASSQTDGAAVRNLTDEHERQLALIHAHNQQLEQQRDLAQQVSVLSEQSNATHLESLLMELREQEERNEETLQQPADQPDPGKNKKMHHDNYELISSVAGPLSTQIALQQAYVQSGGSDPVIVAQMIDLQAQAQSLETNQPAASTKARKKLKPRQRCPSLELLVLEQENQRLEEEILRIQLAREAGFVVFFDLVLGLDASLKALRLVAAVYSEGLQVGPPTPLPPVQCLRGVSLPYSHSLTHGNCALLSVKQPAPIQPSPSLCLVVEVQAASHLDVYNQEVFKMASCGWIQLELFDQYNQVVGNMELCVRLVNGRDGDVQTLAKPDPT
uniref:Coiled-coil domain containing 17 n=1 Tax=Seriola dumerili TaxID=41447 RepID=A0A3B4US92_SERDU